MTKFILICTAIVSMGFIYFISQDNVSVSYSTPDYEQEYYNDIVNKMNGKSRCDFMQANGVDC